MKRFGLLVLLMVFATPTKAEQWMAEDQWTVGWLGNVCSSFEIEDKLICGAYLQGFFAGQQAEAMTSKRSDPKSILAFCRPPNLTVEQIAELVSKFALEHPNAAFENAHFALADHFEKIWPCEK
ncbi:Rap1a/Tai family immunity protein [Altererythrobacter sp. GH1-8]|uniref:Rap1a/Tai family immunity protein n=1 Tax=Altererythrobacter sp. GH1-8 TaxID=3349333 RepID=UPI00374D9C37